MKRRYRFIRPCESRLAQTDKVPTRQDAEAVPPEKRLVKTACQSCRNKKAKCDGKRPSCGRCLRKGNDCAYFALVGETEASARKRTFASQQSELDSFRALFSSIRDRSQSEACNIMRCIKSCHDPAEALDAIEQRDCAADPKADSASYIAQEGGTCDELNYDSLSRELAGLEALPWITVARDDVVSALIYETERAKDVAASLSAA